LRDSTCGNHPKLHGESVVAAAKSLGATLRRMSCMFWLYTVFERRGKPISEIRQVGLEGMSSFEVDLVLDVCE
jgi:hypothetical protein